MADEKDRLGQKLHDVEAAREAQWARQHDAELIENLRKKKIGAFRCPDCGNNLEERKLNQGYVMTCPQGHGGWLGAETLKSIVKNN